MKAIQILSTSAIVGLGTLALVAMPSFAGSDPLANSSGASVQLAHMNQEEGTPWGGQPCPGAAPGSGYGMGHSWQGHGMMMPGYGMGYHMRWPQMHGWGMMPQNRMGRDRMMPDMRGPVMRFEDLSVDDVRHFLEHRLEMHGNKRLKIAEVREADDDKIVADITTLDGSLVERLEFDRHSGEMTYVE